MSSSSLPSTRCSKLPPDLADGRLLELTLTKRVPPPTTSSAQQPNRVLMQSDRVYIARFEHGSHQIELALLKSSYVDTKSNLWHHSDQAHASLIELCHPSK
uniref:Uncharacterized protein n=1 Tax=Arundo donax TaxID=35708 RepID=A0A0A9FIJ2_ARUDO